MNDPDSLLQLARAAAAQLGNQEWSLDAEPIWEEPEPEETPAPPAEASPPPPAQLGNILPPKNLPDPPSPMKILEAMLFVGGAPLTAESACSAIRGLSHEHFRNLVEELARKYRLQNRPYAVVPTNGGYELELKPRYRTMRDGGPREVQLAQPTLDILSLIAYRQPMAKAELDAVAGTDSAGHLRQLSRLGLIEVQRRASGETAAGYGTTPKFLSTFGMANLDDLPKLAEVAD